eukprot:TRINITY_DN9003_c0_g1_i1.p1 TRINITY_DN9003_c0_g1~~TRINITY_DN9003_c0_g1_i1.p1  ORF type:complete len:725 (+),score=279.62 TRINITY_DN9003_c0_g1_i1:46-2175(+)
MEWKGLGDEGRQDSLFDEWKNDNDDAPTQVARQHDRDAILFMIDCQESMFKPNKEGEVPFDMAIQCCIKFYKDKILSSGTDFVGLLLYATQHKLNAYDFNGIYIFHTLARPSAQRIKELESLIQDKEAFKENVGSQNGFPINDALWTAQHLFHGMPQTIGFRRILVFTDDDNPTKDDPTARSKCIARSRDLLEADITLQLFAMKKGLPHQQASASPPTHGASGQYSSSGEFVSSEPIKALLKGSTSLTGTAAFGGASLDTKHPTPLNTDKSDASFDASLFWRHVIYVEEDEFVDKAIHLDAKSSFQELLDPLKRKTHRKRSQASLKVAIGAQGFDTPSMGVKLYLPSVRAKRGTPVNLDAKTNIPLVSETKYICSSTGAILTESDMGRVCDVGKESVVFTPAEMQEMTGQFGTQGLRILGFKPSSSVKMTHQIGTPYFLEPDERTVAGSVKVFTALVLKMAEMDKVAVAEMISRKGSAPRLVALVPQLETHEMDGSRDECFGMHVLPLPYAEDIRDVTLPEPIATPNHDTLVVKAKQIIRRMQLQPAFEGGESRYDAFDYPNPALQKHFTVLQSIALEEDYEKVPDYTLPDYKSMESFKQLFKNYKDVAYAKVYDPERVVGVAGMKRSLADYDGHDPKKVDISSIDFVKHYTDNTLSSLLVAQLRQYCKDNKEDASGLKADLVQTVKMSIKEKLEAKEKAKKVPGDDEQ